MQKSAFCLSWKLFIWKDKFIRVQYFWFKFDDFYFTGEEQKRIDLKALTSVEGKKLLMSGLAGLVLCLLCLRVAFRVSTRLFRASSCRKRGCKGTVCWTGQPKTWLQPFKGVLNAKSLACDTANEHALTCTRETCSCSQTAVQWNQRRWSIHTHGREHYSDS